MNELLHLAADNAKQRGLTLIITRDKARRSKTDLIAGLILNGPLLLVAADEWLPAFPLPRLLHRQVVEIKAITSRLRTIRASTSYRLLDSFINIPSQGEPILVLDFLHTFYDADVPLRVRFMKLRQCCKHLQRLSTFRAVIVTTQELPVEEYDKFLPVLRSVAHRTLYLDPQPEPGQPRQPALF